MIAVLVHADVALAGIFLPSHRTLEVVDDVASYDSDDSRNVLTAGEARALVRAGYADPIEADFEQLPSLIDDWQRA